MLHSFIDYVLCYSSAFLLGVVCGVVLGYLEIRRMYGSEE